MNCNRGAFLELQNFSVNDGNGIRTTIFFAGCPLRCQWCCNPESLTIFSKIAYYEKTCIHCGRCTHQCPCGIGINLNMPDEREGCKACGLCARVCPTNSRRSLVQDFSSAEILQAIEKNRIFYRYSGGGVTFSGGEATLQSDMLRALTNSLYDKAIDIAIETSGYFDFEGIKDILEKQNMIFIDIKHMDDEKHRAYTGVGNSRILENISRTAELQIPIVVRVPVIEGVNTDLENLRRTAQFVKDNVREPKLELLPYHSLGNSKYEALGLTKPSKAFKAPTLEFLKEAYKAIEAEGVAVVSYK